MSCATVPLTELDPQPPPPPEEITPAPVQSPDQSTEAATNNSVPVLNNGTSGNTSMSSPGNSTTSTSSPGNLSHFNGFNVSRVKKVKLEGSGE